MRCNSASSADSWAAARNSTPLRSRPKGTQVANGNACIRDRSCARARSASSLSSQATHSRRQGSSALRIFTAACLSSGCFELGQKAGEVRALTPAARAPVPVLPDRNSSPQCIAMKAWAMPCRSLARAGSTIEPRLDVT